MREDYKNSENNTEGFEEGRIPVHPAPLSKGQKIAAGILAVFAVAVVGMWMVQFKKSITGPLDYRAGTVGDNADTGGAAPPWQEENSEEALKSKDTDGDGLSDWDELYFYKTSPYLEDSDSDGFTDKEEVDSDNDPNCPIGRDCYASSALNTGDANARNGKNNDNSLNNTLNQFGAGNETPRTDRGGDLEAILGGQLDAAALRQMLLDAGMDKKILDKISDDDLMKSYREMLNR